MEKEHKRGFTMVELMIVMMIISILVAILSVSLRAFQHDAKLGRARADVASLGAAIEEYYRHKHTWPVNITDDVFKTNQNLIKSVLVDPFQTVSSTLTTPATYGYLSPIVSGSTTIADSYIVWSDASVAVTGWMVTGHGTVAAPYYIVPNDDIVASSIPIR